MKDDTDIAWLKGYKSYLQGLPVARNPYPPASENWEMWDTAWYIAKQDNATSNNKISFRFEKGLVVYTNENFKA